MPQPRVSASPARVPPHMPCPLCHDVMILSVIQPGSDGQDNQNFKCRGCGHSDTVRLSWRLHPCAP
jgi:transposase-like protein